MAYLAHIEELYELIRDFRRFDAEVDFCDECEPRITCPVHSSRCMDLSKVSRELVPIEKQVGGADL